MASFDKWSIALTIPAAVVAGAFYVAPIVQMLAISVTEPELGFGNYVQLATSGAVARVAMTTLQVSLMTTVITVLASYVVAYGLTTLSPQARRFAFFLVLVPFWISVLVRAFAWITILRRQGVLNGALQGIGVISEPMALVHNRIGVVIGMVHYMMPFAILLLYANFAGIDRRILQAAQSLGARPATVFLRVFLPLSAPGVAVATLFVFIFSLGFLVTPALLGAGRTVMAAEYISVQITNTLRWGVATGLSTVLLVIVGAAAWAAMRMPAFRAAFGGRLS